MARTKPHQPEPEVLTLYRKVEINIGAERVRINTPRLYRKAERAFLNKLLDLFIAGDLEEIIRLVHSVPKDWYEYICSDIHKVLREMWTLGETYVLLREDTCRSEMSLVKLVEDIEARNAAEKNSGDKALL